MRKIYSSSRESLARIREMTTKVGLQPDIAFTLTTVKPITTMASHLIYEREILKILNIKIKEKKGKKVEYE